ncbi:hypothetical protein C5B42_03315 [Candidatus Cerribacteria bacterium 'Amazon FNV 2010 28 9']|uniref:F0F1 ATP synthase subunit gamma n=1 Tax=Candidatus Cerribacteria bacterium 'Amazon FNV 2010 28 9' TaxID=2081795 RepID=A0A317JRA3_9BACT|nr:MAG: hypothetical protein C5B42_03315 [Candidatus Cerribacteria bacterium 'Amazon FNV 2010 28 9']
MSVIGFFLRMSVRRGFAHYLIHWQKRKITKSYVLFYKRRMSNCKIHTVIKRTKKTLKRIKTKDRIHNDMQTLSTVKDETEFTVELERMVRATQEISVMQIQKIRGSVLATRSFMEGLHDIFFDVQQAHQQQVIKLLKTQQDLTKKTEHQKENLFVFISSNHRFSSAITHEVFTLFSQQVKSNTQADILIIGRIGKELFDREFPSRQHTFISMSIDAPSKEDLANVFRILLQYVNIDVYQGQYTSLAAQHPSQINISGKVALSHLHEREQKGPRYFLFEPSLEVLITFFEHQITEALFQLTLHESSLANLGSRISALESSISAVEQYEKKLHQTHLLLLKQKENRKQQQRLAGRILWK